MKYLISYKNLLEKYTHTDQDKIDDMIYINEFVKKFEEKFEYRLNLEYDSEAEFRDYLGFGAGKYYHGEVEILNKYMIQYFINIFTCINPNGIKNENDIGRTFNIDFDIRSRRGGPTRIRKNTRNARINNNIIDFYGYSRNMEELIDRFDEYLLKLDIKHLTEEEKKEKEIEKKMRTYNL